MKKIISLALAAGLLVGASVEAKAADISVSGLFRVSGEVLDNAILAPNADLDPSFKVRERIDLGMTVKVSDEVLGEFRVRMPNSQQWVGPKQELNTTTLRNAYIQFPLAMFTVRAGYQLPALPSIASGANPYSRGWWSMPGVAMAADFGMITPSLSWFVTGYSDDAAAYARDNSFSLVVPVALADGMKLTPWANFGTTATMTASRFGASFDANINNLNAGAGVIYAMNSTDANEGSTLVAANVAMDLGMLTPGVAVWYGLGGNNTSTNFWGSFNGANDTLYGNGNGLQAGIGLSGAAKAPSLGSPFNTLGVQANIANVALGDTAGLGAHVLYVMDMSDVDAGAALEIGAMFNTQVAQGLKFVLDANYVMPMLNEDVVGKDAAGNGFTVTGTLDMAF